MRLKQDYVVHYTGTEWMVVPTASCESQDVVSGNQTFGAIASLLKNESTKEEIAQRIRERFRVPEEVDVEHGIAGVVAKLREIGAIEDE